MLLCLSIQGDVHETFYEVEKEVGMPDYLFLDSWHSHLMGLWYATEVLSRFTKHTYVSLHDVHNPTFWGDDRDDPFFRDVSFLVLAAVATWFVRSFDHPGGTYNTGTCDISHCHTKRV